MRTERTAVETNVKPQRHVPSHVVAPQSKMEMSGNTLGPEESNVNLQAETMSGQPVSVERLVRIRVDLRQRRRDVHEQRLHYESGALGYQQR